MCQENFAQIILLINCYQQYFLIFFNKQSRQIKLNPFIVQSKPGRRLNPYQILRRFQKLIIIIYIHKTKMNQVGKNHFIGQLFSPEKQNGEVNTIRPRNKRTNKSNPSNFQTDKVNKIMKKASIVTSVEDSSEKKHSSDSFLKESLADFKLHLHNSFIMNNSPEKCRPRNKSISEAEHQAMKDRLSKKIKEAQEKMIDIKLGLRQCQAEKQEIIKRSDKRRSDLNEYIII